MIYPDNFEQKTGFDQAREMIAEYCISSMGLRFVDKIRFSANQNILNKLLDQVSEFKHIITSGKPFPARDFFDLRDDLSRLRTPGTFIEQEPLFDLKTTLQVVSEILDFFNNSGEDFYPELKLLTQDVFLPEEVLPAAEKIIDDKGEIRNSASKTLADIRKQLEAKKRQVLKETRKAFEQAKKSGWIPENSEITIRGGRTVIPLKASDKRSLGGIIHDESATGQTVFVEPAVSFELSNQIREIENEERREIIRILTHFTDRIRPYLTELYGLFRYLGIIDFIRAKALFADKINAERPKLTEKKELNLNRAYHPLLYLVHKTAKKEVIPLDIELDKTNRILVISGPNAGGKSVCLKTIGLLQYMVQCGLHIPCSPDSLIPVFDRIFIDIGDEQSLENDLSTYSSHLLNMKHFLRKANENTLFLIDEFGTGTEPQLGGAIAEATLERLNEKKAFGVITTHYSNLKLAAQKNEGLFNGAMLFDSNEMRPLYKLQVGNPGSSFAFEIAKNIGFPQQVLNRAQKKSGGKHISFDKQLQQLEIDKIKADEKESELTGKDEYLSGMIEKYSNLLEDIKRQQKNLIEKARQEAYDIVADSNRAVENTIKEIKEVKADKAKTKDIRKKLVDKKENIRKELTNNSQPVRENKVTEASDKPIEIGDFVRIKNTDIIGELMVVEGKDAVLDINDVKLKTTFAKLVKTERKPSNKNAFRAKTNKRSIMKDINEKAANFSLSIDLRGKRVEEALPLLQKYIDEAILLSASEISILHGKGDGILRPVVRDYLQSIDQVKDYGDAPLEMGGAGITRVHFR